MKEPKINTGLLLQRKGDLNSKVYQVQAGLLRSYTIDEKGKEHIHFAPENWIIGDSGPSKNLCELFIDALEDSIIIQAGIMTMKGILPHDISSSVAGTAGAIEPSTLLIYPKAAGAIIGQQGFNLFWIGVVTFIAAFFVWKGNLNAIIIGAKTGGLADAGCFLFMDLGGFVKFVPGTIMTIVSALAIIICFYAYFKTKKTTQTE